MGDTRSRGDSCGAGVRTPDAGGGSDRLSNSNLEGTSPLFKKKNHLFTSFLLPNGIFNSEKVTYIKSKLLDSYLFASESYIECQEPRGET